MKNKYFTFLLKVNFFCLLMVSCKEKEKENDFLTSFHSDTSVNYRVLNQQFLVGSHLCRKPMPDMNELFHDMALLKQNGFNYIKIQTHWALDEPTEGVYDFSDYERLIQHADSLGLKVYIGLTCEQAPEWLWEKYPDCTMVGKNGIPIVFHAAYTIPADGKPGPCFDSPGARKAMIAYIKALVSTLGKYKNIALWNTWQEIAYWSERIAGTSICYCANTIQHFRQWCEFKYVTLDSLNSGWHTNFSQWKYVTPNRGEKVGTRQDMDWEYFMTNIYVAQTLQTRSAAIREADKNNRPVFAHPSSLSVGSGRDWTYARCQDFIGSSAYPDWSPFHPWDDGAGDEIKDKFSSSSAEAITGLSLNFDYLRSANPAGRPVIAAELQGGPVTGDYGFTRNRFPDSSDIRRWMYTLIGAGATGISFWVTRLEIISQEANSFGLLNNSGDSSERFTEAGRIARKLNQYPEIFAVNNREKGKVAIVINEENWNFCNSLQKYADHLSYSIRGWYRLLYEAGISVDFIELSAREDKKLSDYKAVILPVPVCISDVNARLLAKYVHDGGNLISEACPGRFTETGIARRSLLSPVFLELFGVLEDKLQYVREPANGHRWTSVESGWNQTIAATQLEGIGAFENCRLSANVYLETFEAKTATPILMYGQKVAGSVQSVGKGRAWLLGSFVGHNGTAYKDYKSEAFIRRLLDQCGILPDHTGKLVVRRRLGADKEAWVISNPTPKTVIEKFNCTGFSSVIDLDGLPVAKNKNEISVALKSWEVTLLLLKK